MSVDSSTAKIMERIALLKQLPEQPAKTFDTVTRRAWEEEARSALSNLRTKTGKRSRLGPALLRPRSVDPFYRFTPSPWGGRLRMSAWAARATRGAFELGPVSRERIYRRWADDLKVWRPL